MKIELQQHSIREIFDGYIDNEEEGVYGFSGKLNIRPKYQREFVYDSDRQKAVIQTVMSGFPLNTMYWAKNPDGSFELLDGQQRTLSICHYVNNAFSIRDENGMPMGFDNLSVADQNKILNYKLFIYVCEGTDKEKLEWFKTVNIGGMILTDQELRNACYTGPWLTSAKRYFSKNGCPAKAVSEKYVRRAVIQQGLLEEALKWIAKTKSMTIEEYMAAHQFDDNADELWFYFRNVCDWAAVKFKHWRKEMINQPWSDFYEACKDQNLDADKLEDEIAALMKDNEVQKKSGIYPYVLSHDQRYLNLRAFDDDIKREVYEEQKGICPLCVKDGNPKTHYEINEMQADHITPWIKGGKTVKENCMMLCRAHNAMKSDK